jgi:hypothetical protein
VNRIAQPAMEATSIAKCVECDQISTVSETGALSIIEVEMCEIWVADSPEAETGYVDERAICEHCKNGD